ncbi:transport and Golgi organization protein 11 [Odontomachus brunneus]|uniref:transport and Golgi organization protein 11 n=1 Tax=Odontomachus brunneus TaxID=486640 RepID=UPI0013F186E1|nr:transport and Golgi organization protein 11 [Odontomachus brunneus]XP_032664345.1 transport and Golgi organization protein 11 [Odontomachus brunneus]XP_032664346.1 transport and Golgi organization protein 11 [Odontomachus brunneus]XP_032664347.1 transport and Golgi organization protein 11 [Odontomachus brunneus]XP_032664348.1 transport and Golgi organization protein 11 [Odontomachus brunneus]XP_032664349.1 transport and Golgi organization protein 11 [Odontomachus brunneus]
MAKAHSPTHFNAEPDNIYDPNFTLDINTRMRVPKSIRVNGDYDGDSTTMANGSAWNQALAAEKIEMHVPDRILVVGQEQHIGTKAPPLEIALENSIMPTEPVVRVKTPPRILTLDNYFPTVDEEEQSASCEDREVPRTYNTETQIVRHVREPTPSYGALDVSLPPSEEIQHLRRQVGKLNRRVMALELELMHRQQKEKILYIATVAYLILKAFSWLSRN